MAVVLTSCLNFVLNLVAVFVFRLIYGAQPRATWLPLPVAVAPLLVLTIGFAMCSPRCTFATETWRQSGA
jgi:ABC-type polysaccharide/polyol phosphate export permease